jgi:5-methylcytosine-specific restriction endonuclease McrA
MEQGTSAGINEAGRRHANFKDRTGWRVGKLVVLRISETRKSPGKVYWVCRCDCGEETTVSSWNLGAGGTKSCGCLVSGLKLGPSTYARNQVCKDYKQNARKRGHCWELTDGDFDHLTSQSCFYCELPPSTVKAMGKSVFTYTGIDRKENELGYTPENAVPCCETCNKAKRAMPYAEFAAWIVRLRTSSFTP